LLAASILGTGSAVPDNLVSTEVVLEQAMPGRDAQAMKLRMGIGTRTWAELGPLRSIELAATAVRSALDAAGMQPNDLQRLLFCASLGGDILAPANANLVARDLGIADHCACFDLNNACVGFVSLLDVAARFVATGSGPVAVVASEIFSRHLHPTRGPRAHVVFGDAAGAAILGPSSGDAGMLASHFGNDGRNFRAVTLYHPTITGKPEALSFGMSTREIAAVAIPDMQRAVSDVLDKGGVTREDVDWVVLHQANGTFLDYFLDALGFRIEQTVRHVDRLGSLGSASVAVGLDELFRQRPVKSGDLVLMAAVGSGTARGATLFRVQR
jgi:3-oxoacyl-[acyl-carrier-protein] synthase-3